MHSEPRALRLILSVLILLPFSVRSSLLAREVAEAQPKPRYSELPGVIAGHVYRADTGDPIFNAYVVAHSGQPISGRLSEARTAPDGSFEILAVPPGQYVVEAHADEFLSNAYGQDGPQSRAKTISVSSGQRIEGIDVRLASAGSISGTVYDEAGKPVHGVMVLAIQPHFQPVGSQQVWGGDGESTDADGNFQINRLRPGSYLVRAGGPTGRMKDGFRYPETYYPGTDLIQNAQKVSVVAGRDSSAVNIIVKAEQTHKITGRIADADASPQLRYEIAVTRFDGIQPGTCCDPSGDTPDKNFSTGALPSGDYLLTVSVISRDHANDGWAISNHGYARVSLTDSDTHVNVVMGNGAEIHGSVLIEGQQGAITTPRVALVRADGLQQGPSAVIYKNEFAIRDVPPGSYRFFVPALPSTGYLKAARCSGIDHTVVPLEVNVGDIVTDCELTMRVDAGALGGRVLAGDQPAPGTIVVLIPEETQLQQLEGYTRTAKAGPTGQFQMSAVVPGNYVVFAAPPLVDESYYAPEFISERSREVRHVSVLPGQKLELDLQFFCQPNDLIGLGILKKATESCLL